MLFCNGRDTKLFFDRKRCWWPTGAWSQENLKNLHNGTSKWRELKNLLVLLHILAKPRYDGYRCVLRRDVLWFDVRNHRDIAGININYSGCVNKLRQIEFSVFRKTKVYRGLSRVMRKYLARFLGGNGSESSPLYPDLTLTPFSWSTTINIKSKIMIKNG